MEKTVLRLSDGTAATEIENSGGREFVVLQTSAVYRGRQEVAA